MPVSPELARSNRSETERMKALVALPDEGIAAALARADRPNLDRGSHRAHHLDQIEETLAEAGRS